ncbi:MAG: prepilin-type N-terminal cleavage/methylation domain-containing protein, partial [Nitrospirae bacterium]|nr:prepilin-type N-terminal cleavage/methylation domain-containing protein [Nitrospirota bacterium]
MSKRISSAQSFFESIISRNIKGFSLIELLVVMTIVSILATIAVPQLSIYKQRAFDAVSLTDLRNF